MELKEVFNKLSFNDETYIFCEIDNIILQVRKTDNFETVEKYYQERLHITKDKLFEKNKKANAELLKKLDKCSTMEEILGRLKLTIGQSYQNYFPYVQLIDYMKNNEVRKNSKDETLNKIYDFYLISVEEHSVFHPLLKLVTKK